LRKKKKGKVDFSRGLRPRRGERVGKGRYFARLVLVRKGLLVGGESDSP